MAIGANKQFVFGIKLQNKDDHLNKPKTDPPKSMSPSPPTAQDNESSNKRKLEADDDDMGDVQAGKLAQLRQILQGARNKLSKVQEGSAEHTAAVEEVRLLEEDEKVLSKFGLQISQDNNENEHREANPDKKLKPEPKLLAATKDDKVWTKDTPELVLMVGPPGAGKSSFAETHFVSAGYEYVNRDILKTKAKCIKAVRVALMNGKSAIVDNTNPSIDARAEFIRQLSAATLTFTARCLVMATPNETAEVLNAIRGPPKEVPYIAYARYSKSFQAPTTGEGLASVEKVPFIPNFPSDAEKIKFDEMLADKIQKKSERDEKKISKDAKAKHAAASTIQNFFSKKR